MSCHFVHTQIAAVRFWLGGIRFDSSELNCPSVNYMILAVCWPSYLTALVLLKGSNWNRLDKERSYPLHLTVSPKVKDAYLTGTGSRSRSRSLCTKGLGVQHTSSQAVQPLGHLPIHNASLTDFIQLYCWKTILTQAFRRILAITRIFLPPRTWDIEII